MPCWETRWYEAHGYSQADGEWTFTGDFNFWDESALREFISDAGHFALPPIAGSSPNDFPLDVVGWRVDASGGFIVGIDANINMIYNLDQQRLKFGPDGWEFTPAGLDAIPFK